MLIIIIHNLRKNEKYSGAKILFNQLFQPLTVLILQNII